MRSVISIALLCGMLGVLVTRTAPPAHPAGSQTDGESQKLVSTLRLLNSGEVLYRQQNGRFASLDEMLRFLRGKSDLSPSPIDLNNPRPYALSITTTSDGMHYQIGLYHLSDLGDRSTWCKTAAFSDDRGVIFLAVALGCDWPSSPAPH
jgi:hypothetical protein